jgi:hypothetical protein
VATAMVQSTRMVGSMFGTAVVGTLVTRLYAHHVDAALEAAGGMQWQSSLAEPQILIDHARAARFSASAAAAGHDPAALLGAARDILVGAVHSSQWLVAVVMMLALFWVRRIPPIDLHRPHAREGSSHE